MAANGDAQAPAVAVGHKHKHDFDEHVKPPPDSAKWGKFPPDVIPMWVADTDFRGPKQLEDALVERAKAGMYGYGKADSKVAQKAVKRWLSLRFGWEVEEDAVLYASSVVPALVNGIQAFTEPGDKVLVQTPVYMPFHTIVGGCGREKVTTEMVFNKDAGTNGGPEWSMDFDDIEKKCADPKLKIFLICSPHNPLGRVFTREELQRVADICLKHNVLIFSDEIHFDLVFPSSRNKHICMPTLSQQVADNTLVFINPSKTFNVPGLRCAAMVVPNKALRDKFNAFIGNQKALGSTLFGVVAITTVYNECEDYVDQLMDYLQSNLDFMLKYFKEKIPKIKVTKPEATYLIWLDCRELGLKAPDELNNFFIDKVKLGLNEGTTFGPEGTGFMRMNIACRRATLKDALERIEKAVNELGK